MGKITVVGLGNYGLDELPFGIYRFLNKVEKVYVRTLAHPVVEDLEDIEWISFDEVYEKHDQFSEVYAEIVQTLKEKAMDDDIVYAVPGHPMVAESTTELLLQDEAIDIEVLGGKSFIDDLFQAVSFDPNNGFQMLDGTMMTSEAINIRNALIITQVYDQMIAGDVKVTLMEKYPDNHNVAIVTGARGQGSAVKWCPLYEMDHDFELSNLTSLFVPALSQENYAGDFEYLSSIMDTLVADDGCPFDKAQTHSSLKRYLLEETYELFEAIDNDDIDHMIEELGDILLQVVFHGAIGKKSMMFDTREIVQGISEKMIRRHPHIFGEGVEVNSIEELNQVWKNAKQAEGKEEKQVKQEKIFADLYLKLYDLVNNQQMTVQQALKVLAGEENETR
ncbi:MazG nucleotide pyrophosphohydrolase domain-containing protein [Macrococcoides canis]|uniref:MazG nucleotide pyrophosphohydrolase domain-containing protein n=1 Tax=Macrococcoides canis TaxID=1855823 RepID=UPI0022B93925|nr:MazG nucleotide pyrophosphohydrolase domain-containing protein [Macrococcus canis]WBF52965.1 nucleotide pyrophosphohydrolase [Macrococcus canis]